MFAFKHWGFQDVLCHALPVLDHFLLSSTVLRRQLSGIFVVVGQTRWFQAKLVCCSAVSTPRSQFHLLTPPCFQQPKREHLHARAKDLGVGLCQWCVKRWTKSSHQLGCHGGTLQDVHKSLQGGHAGCMVQVKTGWRVKWLFQHSNSSNRTWDAQREKGMSWHSGSSCRVANLLAQHVRAAAKFSDGWPHF